MPEHLGIGPSLHDEYITYAPEWLPVLNPLRLTIAFKKKKKAINFLLKEDKNAIPDKAKEKTTCVSKRSMKMM